MVSLVNLEYEYREIRVALAQHKAHAQCEECQRHAPCLFVSAMQHAAVANRDLMTYLEVPPQGAGVAV